MRDEDLKVEIHRLEANVAQLGEIVTQNFISLLEIKEQIISVKDHLERLEKEEKFYVFFGLSLLENLHNQSF